jgi:hypothetical protein
MVGHLGHIRDLEWRIAVGVGGASASLRAAGRGAAFSRRVAGRRTGAGCRWRCGAVCVGINSGRRGRAVTSHLACYLDFLTDVGTEWIEIAGQGIGRARLAGQGVDAAGRRSAQAPGNAVGIRGGVSSRAGRILCALGSHRT